MLKASKERVSCCRNAEPGGSRSQRKQERMSCTIVAVLLWSVYSTCSLGGC